MFFLLERVPHDTELGVELLLGLLGLLAGLDLSVELDVEIVVLSLKPLSDSSASPRNLLSSSSSTIDYVREGRREEI